ncbi:MAG: ParM/StbA family protein [Clostridia bacterium]|nr:ParM/StbA family protein [Clostridia bacterium]
MHETNTILIAIDHGYGQIKTPNFVFPTGVQPCFGTPAFEADVLEWMTRRYIIGIGHKEVRVDKTADEDFRLLTMAAMAKELARKGIRKAVVYLALGLPLDWAGDQKEKFRNYMRNPYELFFTFNGIEYEVEIADVLIYPQGFAAVAHRLDEFRGMNMLCDIGHGTMSVMFINAGKPMAGKVYTELMGVHQCVKAMRDAVMKSFHASLEDAQIEDFLRNDNAEIPEKVKQVMTVTAKDYVSRIMGKLGEHGFDPQMMKLHLMGGGMWLVKKFGDLTVQEAIHEGSILLNTDISASAKGYEMIARNTLRDRGVVV